MKEEAALARTVIKKRLAGQPAPDIWFLIILMLLVCYGLVMLFSAGYAVALYRRGDAYTYIRPQLLFAAFGAVAMYAASLVDYHIWHRLAWPVLALSLALLTVVALKASGSDISDGLYGYSPVLTAIALATVFYKPNFRSALWAVLGILVTVFIQAGMYMLMAPVGIATLTGPFCITTWLFLLPLVRFDDEEKPDHSNWYPENKKHLAAQQPGAKTE